MTRARHPYYTRWQPLLIITTLLSGQLHAGEPLQWSGFLNVVGGALTHEPHDDSGRAERATYADYTRDWTFDSETTAGLQAHHDIDSRTSVTAQVLASTQAGMDAARMRWLYLSHDLTPNDRLRVGRIATPFYFFSDFFNVGYAYHWVTPPTDVYAFDTSLTGINYVHRGASGAFDWSVELMTGSGDEPLPGLQTRDASVKARNANMIILNASTGGWLTLRTMYYHMKGTFNLPAITPDALLDAGIDGLVAQNLFDRSVAYSTVRPLLATDALSRIAENIDVKEEPLAYREFAVRIDRNGWLAMAEWVEFITDTYLLGNPQSWYVTGGYRIEDTLVFITRSRTGSPLDDDVERDYETPMPSLTASTTEQARYLAGQVTSRVAAAIHQDTQEVSVGVRWDASTATALKLQIGWLEDHRSVIDETEGIGRNTVVRAALNTLF